MNWRFASALTATVIVLVGAVALGATTAES